MAQFGYHVINYCDDFILISDKADCQAAFEKSCSVLKDLGFAISHKKLPPPSNTAVCLGIHINTEHFQMSIPMKHLS